MSAFMVGDDHIDYLVTAIKHYATSIYTKVYYGSPTQSLDLLEYNPTELGRLLLGTNLRSMQARYPASLDAEEMSAPENYTFRRWDGPQDRAQIFKAVHCLEYQSCEFDEWEQSAAHGVCKWLINRLIDSLPGYEEAMWEVTRTANEELAIDKENNA